MKRVFTSTDLAVSINGSCDSEISVKGLNSSLLIAGLQNWGQGRLTLQGKEIEKKELDIAFDELDGEYVVGEAV